MGGKRSWQAPMSSSMRPESISRLPKTLPLRRVFGNRDIDSGRMLEDIGACQDRFPPIYRGPDRRRPHGQACSVGLRDGRRKNLLGKSTSDINQVGAAGDSALYGFSRLFHRQWSILPTSFTGIRDQSWL